MLYIDKQLRDHNIIQAIARVNRLHQKKLFGYLIDYRGILKELDASIASYQELEERIKGGFDIDDLKGLYARMDTEYKNCQVYTAAYGRFSMACRISKTDKPCVKRWHRKLIPLTAN